MNYFQNDLVPWVQSKIYVTSHVDEDIFKLLYESFLHQLSSIIASAIGTTLFAYVNFEYIFVPRKSREATLLFFYSMISIIAYCCQSFFYIGTWTNRCRVILESTIRTFMNRIGLFFIMLKVIS